LLSIAFRVPPASIIHVMLMINVRSLRHDLALSRSDFSRFLGVSEATVVRWESNDPVSEPRGLPAVLLHAIADALARHPTHDVARVVRSCGVNHRSALQQLLAAAGESG
jgi:DNA-binding XRE family transcriptional regulator